MRISSWTLRRGSISSGGLRALLSLKKLMEERGRDLRLLHVNENILEIFELVGFMEVVTVERDGSPSSYETGK